MGVFDQFPYTNWHELNLDWFIKEFERLQSEWDSFGYTVTATAHPGLAPNVTVTGDLTNGLNFDFTLVKGDQGNPGATGATGNGIASVSIDGSYQLTLNFTDGTSYTTPSLRGPQGAGLEVLDEYATLADLQTDHPVGSAGDMYLVGTSPNFTLYLWSPSQNAWVDGGALTSPSPTVTTPLMDGIADVGLEFTYARGDHVHPVDTSRASATDLSNLDTTVGNLSTTVGNQGTAINAINTVSLPAKQDKLVSGTNIKSINLQSLVGAGDLTWPDYIPLSCINDTATTTSTSSVHKAYDITGSGFIIAMVNVSTNANSGTGISTTTITFNNVEVARDAVVADSAHSMDYASFCAYCTAVSNGDVLDFSTYSNKSGSKTMRYNIIYIGCTVTAQ